MQSLRLPRHYNRNQTCHLCCANKKEEPAYDDFSDNPGWLATLFSWLAFLALYAPDGIPEICKFPNFHQSMAVPELMHVWNLGVLGGVVSSGIMALCKRGVFGHTVGKFIDRLKVYLLVAYKLFETYCRREALQHRQRKFTPWTIGFSKPGVPL